MRIHLGNWIYRLANRVNSESKYSEIRWIIESNLPQFEMVELASLLQKNPKKALELSKYNVDVPIEKLKNIIQMSRDRYLYCKPLQYILGDVYFADLELEVEQPMLIPRPETEQMVRWIAGILSKEKGNFKILDIGTGSGCIALGLACLLPENKAEIIGVDSNENALKLARRNWKNNENKIRNSIDFQCADIRYDRIQGEFDIVISNPPYIPPKKWKDLQDEVKLWEDVNALICGRAGIEIYDSIIDTIVNQRLLRNQISSNIPSIVFEFGDSWQTVSLSHLLQENLNLGCSIHYDSFGNQRWISGHALN
jgi:release factor glutamine methyltransferase